MRILAFLGIAAAMAMAPATAESAPGDASVPSANDWSGVPTIPLRPPAETPPSGHWSRNGGWRADRPDPPSHWGQWRGHRHAFGSFRPRRGLFIPPLFVNPAFFVWNWRGYGLSDPGAGRRWVRYYDDAVLIDERGYIFDTAYEVDWNHVRMNDSDRDDRDREEAMRWGWGWGGYHAYPPIVYYAPAGVATTVVVHGAPMVTTTTTVEEEVVPARPKRAWKPRPKCACK